jgi:hypothetical protein
MKRTCLFALLSIIASTLAVLGGAPAAHASLGTSHTVIPEANVRPNPSKAGQSVFIGVSVYDNSTSCDAGDCDMPSGNIELYDNGTKIATLPLQPGDCRDPEDIFGDNAFCRADAHFDVIFQTVGDHQVKATYVFGNFNDSEAHYTQHVEALNTRTELTQSSTSTVVGEPVTFTATVSSLDPIPSGQTIVPSQVEFVVDGSGTTVSLAGSTPRATLTTSSLSRGAHTILAHYLGTGVFKPSDADALRHDVTEGATTSSLTSSANPSILGDSVLFTATVAPVAPATGTPTGTVTFKDGTTTMGTGTLAGGQATYATSTLSVGHHSITALYGGEPNFTGSTSTPALDQVVNRKPTTTVLSSSSNSIAFGKPITLTATVTGPGGPPTGTVTFSEGSKVLATVPLTNGAAVLTTSALTPGTHNLSAVYSGDATFDASTGTLTQTVTCTNVVTNVAGSYTVASGQAVCFSGVTIGGTLTVQPGGAVSLVNARLSGNVIADGASAFRLCGSPVGGNLTVRNATGPVVIGKPAEGCAGSLINGALMLANNGAGVDFMGNEVRGTATIDGTTGGTTIGANTFRSSLSCSANAPDPTNGGAPNTVVGRRAGQCSSPSF